MKKPLSIKEPGGLDRWWSVVDANNEIVCVGIENKPLAAEQAFPRRRFILLIIKCLFAVTATEG